LIHQSFINFVTADWEISHLRDLPEMSVKSQDIFKPLISIKFPLIENVEVIVILFFRLAFLCVNFKFGLWQHREI
jgi:hypothetical protein